MEDDDWEDLEDSEIPIKRSKIPTVKKRYPRTPTTEPKETQPKPRTGLFGFDKIKTMLKAQADFKSKMIEAESGNPHCNDSSNNNTPWADRNHPKNKKELFVATKKVDEFQYWLSNSAVPSRNASKICVLSGPTGCGKTATVHTIAKELEITVLEWSLPMTLTEFVPRDNDDLPQNGSDVYGKSQLEFFTEFLLQGSRYNSLPVKTLSGSKGQRNRVVVVEDFPNFIYRDIQVFHNILSNLAKMAHFPIVFIVSDSTSKVSSFHRLFPADLMQRLRITNISFNSVAVTFVSRFLKDVCANEKISPEQSIISNIAAVCNGDVRCAINTLQFVTLKEKPCGPFKRPAPKVNSKKFQNVGQKDDKLFLFHALGKVLYAKRDSNMRSLVEEELCEALYEHKRRFPLTDNPDEVTNKIEVSTDTFLEFLQQNYLHFFPNVEDAMVAATHLADAESVLSSWKFDTSGTTSFQVGRDIREDFALSTASRGLMHTNGRELKTNWRPLQKPACIEARRKINDCFETGKKWFGSKVLMHNFFLDEVPFYWAVRSMKYPDGCKAFLQELCKYSRSKKFCNNMLEKDSGEVELEEPESNIVNVKVPCVNSEVLAAEMDDEEEDPIEFNIEEYDD